MNTHRLRHTATFAIVCASLCLLVQPSTALALGGTMRVVRAGQDVTAEQGWPQGVAKFLNQPARLDGWNDFFSEWPNDVNQYKLHPMSSDEVNELIASFSRIESDSLQLILCPMQEPRGYGWVSSLPEGNGTPMMFTIGNQQRLDEWFKRLPDGKLGMMEFESPPVAVPPSLTLFVGHEVIELQKLEIPDNITVQSGCLPRLWHKSNLKPSDPPTESDKSPKETKPLDADIKSRVDEIEAFLESRTKPTTTTAE